MSAATNTLRARTEAVSAAEAAKDREKAQTFWAQDVIVKRAGAPQIQWHDALALAVEVEFLDGVRGDGLKVVPDNDSQLTACRFMAELRTLGMEQVFTSYSYYL
jgi:hypothetical protein